MLVAPSLTSEDGDQEGIPNVIKEAMASGLPVISTFHSGIPELVIDGDNGLLVPSADKSALASAIERLASDRTLLERLSTRALESARNLPAWDDFEKVLTEKLLPRLRP